MKFVQVVKSQGKFYETVPCDDGCPVCMESFSWLAQLSCGHSFCTTCISTLHNERTAKCPLCREDMTRQQTELAPLESEYCAEKEKFEKRMAQLRNDIALVKRKMEKTDEQLLIKDVTIKQIRLYQRFHRWGYRRGDRLVPDKFGRNHDREVKTVLEKSINYIDDAMEVHLNVVDQFGIKRTATLTFKGEQAIQAWEHFIESCVHEELYESTGDRLYNIFFERHFG